MPGGLNGSSIAPPRPSITFKGVSAPGTPKPAPSKGNALHLGASKTQPSQAGIEALAAEWAEDEETIDAWDGDLMDVNADADDWSKYILVI